MKPLMPLMLAAVLLALTACPKPPGGTAAGPTAGNPVTPPVATHAAPANSSAAPAQPGTPTEQLALDGLFVGMDLARATSMVPPKWEAHPTWAPDATDKTGRVTYNAPPQPPVKGAVTPPEVLIFAFLDGKLVGAMKVKPGTSQAEYDSWVGQSTTKFGPSSSTLPEFAKSCEFLDQMKFPPPESQSIVWNDGNKQEVLALQFTPSMGMANYMLVSTQDYSKVQQAIMAQPGNSAPPAGGASTSG